MEYRVAFRLYSKDGKREVEVREFNNDETYIVEREQDEEVAATFIDRHEGRMVGPFASPDAAEKFIITTTWFRGSET